MEERPNCPKCKNELAKFCGHKSIHWYCHWCRDFVYDKEIEKQNNSEKEEW